jgi:alpha-mannosidase
LADFNADQRVTALINHVQQVFLAHKAKHNVMLPFGDDFTFQNARQSFEHVETIIELCNKYNTLNLKFIMSTPQTYVDALKKETVMWPVKKDDFYPYSVIRNNYWSGYYTSRPAFKKQVKVGSALLHA